MRRPTMYVVVVLGLLSAAEAAAQGDRQSPAPITESRTPDFLFGRPRGWVGVRGNWLLARAHSDFYSFVTDQLTLTRKDFNAPGATVDVGIGLGQRADAVVGVDFNRATRESEYRRFVDNNRLPINQNTMLQTVSVTGSVKFALTERGLEVSRLAYVPRGIVPYAGAGGGALYYRLEQSGDFVDFNDFSVFGSSFKSAGWAPVAQAFAGVDVRVLRRVYVTLDGRYRWAHATLSSTWVNFDPIDLAGFKLAAGASFIF